MFIVNLLSSKLLSEEKLENFLLDSIKVAAEKLTDEQLQVKVDLQLPILTFDVGGKWTSWWWNQFKRFQWYPQSGRNPRCYWKYNQSYSKVSFSVIYESVIFKSNICREIRLKLSQVFDESNQIEDSVEYRFNGISQILKRCQNLIFARTLDYSINQVITDH